MSQGQGGGQVMSKEKKVDNVTVNGTCGRDRAKDSGFIQDNTPDNDKPKL